MRQLPPEIERLRAAFHDVAFFGKRLLRRTPPPPAETTVQYREAWEEAQGAVYALPKHLYDAIAELHERGQGWRADVLGNLDRIAPANTPAAAWGDIIGRLGDFYQHVLNLPNLHIGDDAPEEPKKRKRWTVEKAEKPVRDYCRKHTEAGRNEIAKETGIPGSTVSRTQAYEDHQARQRVAKGRKPKMRSLSNVEHVAGEGQKHEVLEKLMAEQEADSEASPLDEHGDNPRVDLRQD